MLKRTPTAALLLTLLGQAQATQYPLTVTDDLGRQVTLAREPRRVVAMLPSHTETLFALGAGDKLVGVDVYSNAPAAEVAKIRKVGSGYAPDLEAIVALKPDLVLADESSGSRLTEKLAAAGLNVYGGTAQTYNEVFSKISTIGKLVNRERNAVRLVTQMRGDINALQAKLAGAKPVSVYYEVDPTPYAAGPDSFIGALVSKAGGRNVVPAALGPFPKIDPELIVQKNPAAIVGPALRDAAARPGWAGITAIKTGRVYQPTPAEDDVLSRPGPRLVQALTVLARFLHPERF